MSKSAGIEKPLPFGGSTRVRGAKFHRESNEARQHTSRHKFDFRISVPFAGQRYYMVFLLGKEGRSIERLDEEGQLISKRSVVFYGSGLVSILIGIIVSAVIFFYSIIKLIF